MTAYDMTGEKTKKGISAYNVLILCFVALGSMSYGYAASIIGTTLGQPTFIEYFSLDTVSNGTDLMSTMNGLFQTGGVIGTLLLPTVADKWGRKWAMAVSSLLILISGAILAGSTNIAEFIVFRFTAGAGAFMILAAVPIYMNEVVPEHLRGGLVDIHAVFLILGYTIQGWVGFGFYFWKAGGNNTWRVPLAIQCIWPALLLLGLYWVPESPRWLVMNDRAAEAEVILKRLHSDKSDPGHEYARSELYQIQKQIIIDRTLGNSWASMFKKPSYRKRAWLAIGTTAIIQCSGVLVINNYGPTVYRNLGYSVTKQLLYPAAWLTFGLGVNTLAMFVVDLFPRNKYMATGVFGCQAALIIEAALIANFVPSTNTSALEAAVAMLYVFQVFYSFGCDGTQFAYLGELFPNHLRAKGVCLGVAVISFMNIIWLQAAPTAFLKIGWKFYLCFIIPGTIGSICMWLFWPDTRGLPLEEIAAIFGDADEVAIYQREIVIDHQTHSILGLESGGRVDGDGEKEKNIEQFERSVGDGEERGAKV